MFAMSVQEEIQRLVVDNRVVLFMKGSRMAPQCGFSARAVDILDEYLLHGFYAMGKIAPIGYTKGEWLERYSRVGRDGEPYEPPILDTALEPVQDYCYRVGASVASTPCFWPNGAPPWS